MKAPLDSTHPIWPWWLALIIYYPVTCLGHLQFSLWLVRSRTFTIRGNTYDYAYSYAVPWLAAFAAVALLWTLWQQARRSTQRGPAMAYWLLWIVAVALVDRYLTYSLNEVAHYPQYALLAWMLARVLDPQRKDWPVGRVLFWTTLLGALDEVLQYLWVTRSYSDYLDFNDFLVNLLAAAAGMMLYYGFAERPRMPSRPPQIEWCLAAAITIASILAIGSGRVVVYPTTVLSPPGIIQNDNGTKRLWLQQRPDHYGSQTPGKRYGHYYVLPPWAGVTLLLVVGGLFSRFASWEGNCARADSNNSATA